MIPYTAVQGYTELLNRVRAAGVADLDRLLASLAGLSGREQEEALMELLPDLGEKYVGASSVVTAEFFTELQDMQEVKKPVAAEILEGTERKSWQALVGWGAAGRSLAEQTMNDVFFSLLSGGFTKRLTEAASDTMYGNAANQGNMRYQRVPAPGCCGFCAMLATRGATYTSKESAESVVGRGVPVDTTRGKRGGQGRGLRPRGSRQIGQTFHDNCKCRAVALTARNEVELGAHAEKYMEAYAEAAANVRSDLTMKYTGKRWAGGSKYARFDSFGVEVDAKAHSNRIANEMSKLLA